MRKNAAGGHLPQRKTWPLAGASAGSTAEASAFGLTTQFGSIPASVDQRARNISSSSAEKDDEETKDEGTVLLEDNLMNGGFCNTCICRDEVDWNPLISCNMWVISCSNTTHDDCSFSGRHAYPLLVVVAAVSLTTTTLFGRPRMMLCSSAFIRVKIEYTRRNHSRPALFPRLQMNLDHYSRNARGCVRTQPISSWKASYSWCRKTFEKHRLCFLYLSVHATPSLSDTSTLSAVVKKYDLLIMSLSLVAHSESPFILYPSPFLNEASWFRMSAVGYFPYSLCLPCFLENGQFLGHGSLAETLCPSCVSCIIVNRIQQCKVAESCVWMYIFLRFDMTAGAWIAVFIASAGAARTSFHHSK